MLRIESTYRKRKGLYSTEKLHFDSEAVAVPHLPQCAHWGTFPPGEGVGAPAPVQLLQPICNHNQHPWS